MEQLEQVRLHRVVFLCFVSPDSQRFMCEAAFVPVKGHSQGPRSLFFHELHEVAAKSRNFLPLPVTTSDEPTATAGH